MCGIYGYFSRRNLWIDDLGLAAAAATIAHRGPDDHGIYHEPGRVALGNQRLAIIDVEHGNQPFVSDDGSIVLVQNGEIFNYVELAAELRAAGVRCSTGSDTEVLLRLYERHGIEFVHRLNGMFAIAIFDARADCLYLVRDHVGEKPLFVAETDDGVRFGSEIKAVLAAGHRVAVDDQAIIEYLTFNYVPPPLTMFEGVRHVMPGHWIRFDRSTTTDRRWWDLADREPYERDDEQWLDDITAVLDDSVNIRMRCDVPFGAFLSGGVDSSTVVGLMARALERPVRTFSIGFDDDRFDESPHSNEAAARFSTDHVLDIVRPDVFANWRHVIRHCDQPHGDVSFLPMLHLASLAARHVKVVLTGDGADELFAGYTKYAAAAEAGGSLGRNYHNASLTLFDAAGIGALLTGEFGDRVSGHDPYAHRIEPLLDRARHMDPLNQALYLDTMLLLPGNNLVKPDRMTMAESIENRAPFLDHRLVELAFTMPGNRKIHEGESKYLLKRAVAPLIGHDLAYRSKQMFTVPVGEWLKSHMYGYARELLLSETAGDRGIFEPGHVETMLEDHRTGRRNHTRELRALMALELWFAEFIDSGP